MTLNTYRNFDLLFLMSYDLHGSWENNVDLHGRLRPTKGGTFGNDVLNTVSSRLLTEFLAVWFNEEKFWILAEIRSKLLGK